MTAKSIKGASLAQIAAGFKESLADGFKPTLAFVFISIKQDIKTICHFLNEEGLEIFGATTSGEFIDGDISKESAVIMLMDINRSYFKILFEECAGKNTRLNMPNPAPVNKNNAPLSCLFTLPLFYPP